MEELGRALPDAVVGFNSLGACASVNHLHLHLLVEPAGLPLASGGWTHEGGPLPYPLRVERLGSPDELAGWVEQALAAGRAHHVLLTPGRAWGLLRAPQGQGTPAPWTTGVAFLEAAGVALVADPDHAAAVEQELRRVRGP
jgi:hypothetical protein